MNKFLRMILFITIMAGLNTCAAFAQTKFITIVTGGTGGAAYPAFTILSNTFNKELKDTGFKWSAQSSGGSLENLQMLGRNETLLGSAGAGPTFYAYNGLEMFKGKQIRNLRYILGLWPEPVQVVYRKASGIREWKDLRGKKVAVGPAGGGGTLYMPILLKATAGLTFNDIKPEYLSYSDGVQAMQNGLVDAFYSTAGLPTGAVAQAFASRIDCDLLEMSDEQVKNLKKIAPFYSSGGIPKGTYPGQNRDIHTPATLYCFLSLPEVPEEIVYKMLQVMEKKQNELKQQHKALSYLSFKDPLDGLAGAPLHAGAVRFFKSKGINIPDNFIPPEIKK
jgi:TRAP transporter TAXI family solute receptor